jgi:uncharacterized protein YndB with AHSA1/START domain
MKWIGIVLGVILVLVAGVFAIGAMLPRDHVATSATVIRAPIDSVWQAITTVQEYPRWRDGVESVEVLPGKGTVRWREVTSQGAMTLERVDEVRPRRVVARIADEDLPFGGAWIYELEPVPEGTRIRITEDGYVSNPLFRFVARFILGHHASLEDYMESLGRRFGHDVAVTRA